MKTSKSFESLYNLHILSVRGQIALHKAAWYGYHEICKILVETGASLFITDYQVNNYVILYFFLPISGQYTISQINSK